MFADVEVSAHSYIAGVLQNTLPPAETTPRHKSFLQSALVTIVYKLRQTVSAE